MDDVLPPLHDFRGIPGHKCDLPPNGGAASSGFTLIELMIAVAIIGVVSAIAVPAYRSYVDTANMSKVNAAYENAVRVAQHVFSKAQTRLAIGLPSGIPTGNTHWDRVGNWIALFDSQGVDAPGGGPAYVDTRTTQEEANQKGAIRINYSPSSGELTVYRPAYHELTRVTAIITMDSMEVKQNNE